MIFSNWNDGRDHYAVMHDEVMIGKESAGSYVFVCGPEFVIPYIYEWAGMSRNVFQYCL